MTRPIGDYILFGIWTWCILNVLSVTVWKLLDPKNVPPDGLWWFHSGFIVLIGAAQDEVERAWFNYYLKWQTNAAILARGKLLDNPTRDYLWCFNCRKNEYQQVPGDSCVYLKAGVQQEACMDMWPGGKHEIIVPPPFLPRPPKWRTQLVSKTCAELGYHHGEAWE